MLLYAQDPVVRAALPAKQASSLRGKSLGYYLCCLVTVWHLINIIGFVNAGTLNPKP